MKLEALDGDKLALTVEGLEWDALHIPVVRTNEHAYPPGEPRRGWPQWRPKGASGRTGLLDQIRSAARGQPFPPEAVRLELAHEHVPGLIEILKQNRRVEWNLSLVPRELVTQMLAAIEAFVDGVSIPVVETERITNEWNEQQRREWGKRQWGVVCFGLTERRARFLAAVLRFLRLGDFAVSDPRETFVILLDYTTSARLKAALAESDAHPVIDYRDGKWINIPSAQARIEMRDLLEVDDFLDHARKPTPDEFD